MIRRKHCSRIRILQQASGTHLLGARTRMMKIGYIKWNVLILLPSKFYVAIFKK